MPASQTLDHASQARLQQLLQHWEQASASADAPHMGAADLRLLLEHSDALRQLVRAIALEGQPRTSQPTPHEQNPAAQQPTATALGQAHTDLTDCTAQCQALRAQKEHWEQQAKDWQAQCHHSQAAQQQQQQAIQALQAQLQQAHADLNSRTAQHQAVLAESTRLQQQAQDLQTQLRAAEQRLQPPAALQVLRNDPQLAQEMGLGELSADDDQARVHTIAVLAQLDSIQRLWARLKERCETQQRPISTDEQTLLQAALDLHNHNWHKLPYRWISPPAHSRFDYETQLRSRHVTKGESVTALLLPGIADGQGTALCKALVMTA